MITITSYVNENAGLLNPTPNPLIKNLTTGSQRLIKQHSESIKENVTVYEQKLNGKRR